MRCDEFTDLMSRATWDLWSDWSPFYGTQRYLRGPECLNSGWAGLDVASSNVSR